MANTRERWIEQIRELLGRSGFYVADTHGVRPSSFDLAARRDATLLLIKVLKNIDALGSEEASRLLELGRLFPATVLIIGQASGAAELAPGVVYTRYGVPIVNEESLREYLEEGIPPFLYASPGGTFARISGVRLRELRQGRGLSLGTLASVAGVSRRAIQLYEEGAGAEVDVIERIENFLGEPIVSPIPVFGDTNVPTPPPHSPAPSTTPPPSKVSGGDPSAERPRPRTGDALRDGVLDQLDGLGFEVTVTVRAPFDAFSRSPQILLTGVGTLRTALHRAEILYELSRVAEGHAMFVVSESVHRPSIDGLPILNVRELRRHRDRDDLFDDLSEREGP
ncbi:MAG: helix-turn-helix domain-containing protein [Thermoplasmata archaeon]|jgi:putative transcriptional regulator|nr:helix-turn-helix domain-containing protein [Thermoplasmata archaeon]